MNPLNYSGPEFLEFFLWANLVGLIAYLIVRWISRGSAGTVTPEDLQLDAAEAAFLAGGPWCAVQAAVAGLVRDGHLVVNPQRGCVKPSGKEVQGEFALQRAIHRAADSIAGLTVSHLREKTSGELAVIEKKLISQELILERGRALTINWLALFPLILLLVLGIAKIVVGINLKRPVLYLGLSSFLLALGIYFLGKWLPLRTRRGSKVLRSLREAQAGLGATYRSAPDRLTSEDMVLAVGLFGLAGLSQGGFVDLQTALRPQKVYANNTGNPDSSWSSSCGGYYGGGCSGGGCSGGGGCGGGGGGGGGCGGCGGCGGGG